MFYPFVVVIFLWMLLLLLFLYHCSDSFVHFVPFLIQPPFLSWTRLRLFSKCGGSWEMLMHVCRLPLTGSSLWGPAVKFFLSLFLFQRQKQTQRPDIFNRNSFDPTEFHLLPRTLAHPHPAPLSRLPPSSFCHFIALPRPCSTGREKTSGSLGGRSWIKRAARI